VRLTRATKSTLGKRREPIEEPEIAIAIRDEYITLAQALKMAGIVGSGGEAKYYLMDNAVEVNGEAEQRRGRKLRPGDLIRAAGVAPIRLIAESTQE